MRQAEDTLDWNSEKQKHEFADLVARWDNFAHYRKVIFQVKISARRHSMRRALFGIFMLMTTINGAQVLAKDKGRAPSSIDRVFSACEFTMRNTPDLMRAAVSNLNNLSASETTFVGCPTNLSLILAGQNQVYSLSLSNNERCVYSQPVDEVLPIQSVNQRVSFKIVCEKIH